MNGFNDDSSTLCDVERVRRMKTRHAPLKVVEGSVATDEEIQAIIDRNKVEAEE